MTNPTSQQFRDAWRREEAIVGSIARRLPQAIVVASDLHLSAGREGATGGWDDLENFTADEAFGRWLSAEHGRLEASQWQGLLVLNGDVFDFLRVMRVPDTDGDFERWQKLLSALGPPWSREDLEPTARERSHGLETHEHKTIWKLDILIRGHQPFFDALATWLGRGHAILIVIGNHDVELHWALVRDALRLALVRHGAPEAAVRQELAFVADAVVLGNLHIEHGHEHERLTRVDGGPLRPNGKIRLPFGSLINRYFVNHLERMNPFLDNMKPPTSAILALVGRRPLSVFEVYFRSFRFIKEAWLTARGWTLLYALGMTVAMALPLVLVGAVVSSASAGRVGYGVVVLCALLSPMVTTLISYAAALGREIVECLRLKEAYYALRKALRRFGGSADSPFSDPYLPTFERGVRAKLRGALPWSEDPGELVYAVVGHTHEQKVRVLESRPRRELLVNTGTWIALWPKSRPDLLGRVQYTFARFTWDANLARYQHQLLEWDDQAREARPADFFAAAERPPPLDFATEVGAGRPTEGAKLATNAPEADS